MYKNASWHIDSNPFKEVPQSDKWNNRRHTVKAAVEEHKRYTPEFMDFITDVFLVYRGFLADAGKHKMAKVGAAGGVAAVGVGADYLSDGHVNGDIDFSAILANLETVTGPDELYNVYEKWNAAKQDVLEYEPHVTAAARVAAAGSNPESNAMSLAGKYWKQISTAITGVTLGAGCTDKDDDGDIVDDVAAPMDKVIGYVGTEGFGIHNVEEELYEKGLFVMVEDEQSGNPVMASVAAVATSTYFDKDGNEITTLKIGHHEIDEPSLPEGWEKYLIPESEIIDINMDLVDKVEHDGHKHYIELFDMSKVSKMNLGLIPHPIIDDEIYAVLIVDQEAFDNYRSIAISNKAHGLNSFKLLPDGRYGCLIKVDRVTSVICPYNVDDYIDAKQNGGYYQGFNLYKVDSETGKWVTIKSPTSQN